MRRPRSHCLRNSIRKSSPKRLDDDLNVSAGLGAMFRLIRDSNRLIDAGQLSAGQARSLLDWREKFESVLALSADEEGIPEEVREMLLRRAEAREKAMGAQRCLA